MLSNPYRLKPMKPKTEINWVDYTKRAAPILQKIRDGGKATFRERLFAKIYIKRLKKRDKK